MSQSPYLPGPEPTAAERFAALASGKTLRQFGPRPLDPLRDELERLAAAGYPTLAALLAAKFHEPADPGVADQAALGRVMVSTHAVRHLALLDVELRDFLARHVAGDHGEGPGNESGLLRSKYPLFSEAEAAARRVYAAEHPLINPTGRRPGDCIIVITLLEGDRKTIVLSGRE